MKLILYYLAILLIYTTPAFAVTTEDTPYIKPKPKIQFIGDERINGLAQIAYDTCINTLGEKGNDDNWYYSCVNMVLKRFTLVYMIVWSI